MKQINGRKVIEEVKVFDLSGKQRIYDYLPGKLVTIPSRKGVKKSFGRNQIILNGKIARSADLVQEGDAIQVLEYLGTVSRVYPLTLKILYEDDYLAIVEKPPGIPTSGNQWKTLQNSIPYNIKTSSLEDALAVPLTVHRLDAKTHGLVIVAKSAGVRISLGEMFEQRKIIKKYIAIVQGKLEGEGEFTSIVDSKEAQTEYKVIEHFRHVKDEWNTIVELTPKTGRKHQLRVQLSEAGYSIVGDVKYSEKDDVLKGKGIFLSANQLEFTHPINKENILVSIETPSKFKSYIDRSKRWFERVGKSD